MRKCERERKISLCGAVALVSVVCCDQASKKYTHTYSSTEYIRYTILRALPPVYTHTLLPVNGFQSLCNSPLRACCCTPLLLIAFHAVTTVLI
jgi:hypothetical protein